MRVKGLDWQIKQTDGIFLLVENTGQVTFSMSVSQEQENYTALRRCLEWLWMHARTKEEWEKVQVDFISVYEKDLEAQHIEFNYLHSKHLQ